MMEGVRIWKDRNLFCIIQLYILGVLYENMNTSIKYVLQGHDEIK